MRFSRAPKSGQFAERDAPLPLRTAGTLSFCNRRKRRANACSSLAGSAFTFLISSVALIRCNYNARRVETSRKGAGLLGGAPATRKAATGCALESDGVRNPKLILHPARNANFG